MHHVLVCHNFGAWFSWSTSSWLKQVLSCVCSLCAGWSTSREILAKAVLSHFVFEMSPVCLQWDGGVNQPQMACFGVPLAQINPLSGSIFFFANSWSLESLHIRDNNIEPINTIILVRNTQRIKRTAVAICVLLRHCLTCSETLESRQKPTIYIHNSRLLSRGMHATLSLGADALTARSVLYIVTLKQ